jgi:MFS family permease
MTVRDLSISIPQQRRVLSVLVFAAVLIWIDTTILGIALERIADPRTGLGATPGELQWAVGSYALLFATALFAAGALGDRYGHRTILVLGLLCFGAASLWAAWAGDATGLILARGLMGLGGAMMMPTSMAIIGATFPPERRAGAIAAWSASSGVGVALGPLLGGVLVDHFWWGSVFLVNLPVAALALVGVLVVVPNPKLPQRRRPDPVGLVLSTAGLALSCPAHSASRSARGSAHGWPSVSASASSAAPACSWSPPGSWPTSRSTSTRRWSGSAPSASSAAPQWA